MDMQSANLSNPDLSFPANPPFHTHPQTGVPPGSQLYVHSRPLHLETSFSASSGRTTPSADEYSPSGISSDHFPGRDLSSSSEQHSRFHSPDSLALLHSSHTRHRRPSSLGPNGFRNPSIQLPTERSLGVPENRPGSQFHMYPRPPHLETAFSASSGRTTPSADEYSPSGLSSDRFLGRDPFSSNERRSRFHSPNSLALPHSSCTRDRRPSSLGPNGFHTQSTLMPTEHLYSATEVPPEVPPEIPPDTSPQVVSYLRRLEARFDQLSTAFDHLSSANDRLSSANDRLSSANESVKCGSFCLDSSGK